MNKVHHQKHFLWFVIDGLMMITNQKSAPGTFYWLRVHLNDYWITSSVCFYDLSITGQEFHWLKVHFYDFLITSNVHCYDLPNTSQKFHWLKVCFYDFSITGNVCCYDLSITSHWLKVCFYDFLITSNVSCYISQLLVRAQKCHWLRVCLYSPWITSMAKYQWLKSQWLPGSSSLVLTGNTFSYWH